MSLGALRHIHKVNSGWWTLYNLNVQAWFGSLWIAITSKLLQLW